MEQESSANSTGMSDSSALASTDVAWLELLPEEVLLLILQQQALPHLAAVRASSQSLRNAVDTSARLTQLLVNVAAPIWPPSTHPRHIPLTRSPQWLGFVQQLTLEAAAAELEANYSNQVVTSSSDQSSSLWDQLSAVAASNMPPSPTNTLPRFLHSQQQAAQQQQQVYMRESVLARCVQVLVAYTPHLRDALAGAPAGLVAAQEQDQVQQEQGKGTDDTDASGEHQSPTSPSTPVQLTGGTVPSQGHDNQTTPIQTWPAFAAASSPAQQHSGDYDEAVAAAMHWEQQRDVLSDGSLKGWDSSADLTPPLHRRVLKLLDASPPESAVELPGTQNLHSSATQQGPSGSTDAVPDLSFSRALGSSTGWRALRHVTLHHLPSFHLPVALLPHVAPALTRLELCRRLPEPAQEEEQGEDVTEDKGSMWRALRQLKSLKELHLEGWTIQEADQDGLEGLSGLHELTRLTVKGSRNQGDGLRCVRALTSLRDLTLDTLIYTQTIIGEFVELSLLTRLSSLRFITVGPLPDEVAALASLSLQRFEVSSHFEEGLLPVLMNLFMTTTTLASLNISNFELGESMLRALAQRHPHLTHLSVARLYLGPGIVAEAGPAAAPGAAAGGGGTGAAQPPSSALAAVQLRRLKSLVMSFMDPWMVFDLPLGMITPNITHLHITLLPLPPQAQIQHSTALHYHPAVRLLLGDGDAGAQDGEAGTTSTNGSASAGASLCPLTSVTSLTSHSWLISERLVRGMPNVRTLEVIPCADPIEAQLPTLAVQLSEQLTTVHHAQRRAQAAVQQWNGSVLQGFSEYSRSHLPAPMAEAVARELGAPAGRGTLQDLLAQAAKDVLPAAAEADAEMASGTNAEAGGEPGSRGEGWQADGPFTAPPPGKAGAHGGASTQWPEDASVPGEACTAGNVQQTTAQYRQTSRQLPVLLHAADLFTARCRELAWTSYREASKWGPVPPLVGACSGSNGSDRHAGQESGQAVAGQHVAHQGDLGQQKRQDTNGHQSSAGSHSLRGWPQTPANLLQGHCHAPGLPAVQVPHPRPEPWLEVIPQVDSQLAILESVLQQDLQGLDMKLHHSVLLPLLQAFNPGEGQLSRPQELLSAMSSASKLVSHLGPALNQVSEVAESVHEMSSRVAWVESVAMELVAALSQEAFQPTGSAPEQPGTGASGAAPSLLHTASTEVLHQVSAAVMTIFDALGRLGHLWLAELAAYVHHTQLMFGYTISTWGWQLEWCTWNGTPFPLPEGALAVDHMALVDVPPVTRVNAYDGTAAPGASWQACTSAALEAGVQGSSLADLSSRPEAAELQAMREMEGIMHALVQAFPGFHRQLAALQVADASPQQGLGEAVPGMPHTPAAAHSSVEGYEMQGAHTLETAQLLRQHTQSLQLQILRLHHLTWQKMPRAVQSSRTSQQQQQGQQGQGPGEDPTSAWHRSCATMLQLTQLMLTAFEAFDQAVASEQVLHVLQRLVPDAFQGDADQASPSQHEELEEQEQEQGPMVLPEDAGGPATLTPAAMQNEAADLEMHAGEQEVPGEEAELDQAGWGAPEVDMELEQQQEQEQGQGQGADDQRNAALHHLLPDYSYYFNQLKSYMDVFSRACWEANVHGWARNLQSVTLLKPPGDPVVTDASIRQLVLSIPGLKELSVQSAQLLTDDSLLALSQASMLQKLTLSEAAQVTRQGVAALVRMPEAIPHISAGAGSSPADADTGHAGTSAAEVSNNGQHSMQGVEPGLKPEVDGQQAQLNGQEAGSGAQQQPGKGNTQVPTSLQLVRLVACPGATRTDCMSIIRAAAQRGHISLEIECIRRVPRS